jgi:hypothetical protein
MRGGKGGRREEGLESKVTANGTVTIDEDTSYITITDLPIGDSATDVPSVLREFRQPVTVKAIEMTLISAPTTERPASDQGSATPSQPPSAKQSSEVTFKVLTRKPGDDDFTEVSIGSSQRPEVSTRKEMSFTRSWTSLVNVASCLCSASVADQRTSSLFSS